MRKLATTLGSALTALFVTVLIANPALASEGEGHDKIDTLAEFSRAGEGVNYVAIAIVMVVLLLIVLGGATAVSNLFKKPSDS